MARVEELSETDVVAVLIVAIMEITGLTKTRKDENNTVL